MTAKHPAAPPQADLCNGVRPDFKNRAMLAAAIAVVGEAVVVLLAFSPAVPMTGAVLLHAVVCGAAAALLFWNSPGSSDLTVAAAALLVVAVAGPAGVIAALLLLPFAGSVGAGPAVLSAWYDRLANASGSDAATAMHDRVIAGRVVRPDARSPHDFAEVIESGTLAERQAALGFMARRFHTDFAPALALALRSPEPVVRVQAAAVVARVRADLKVRTKSLLDDTPGVRSGLAKAAELLRLAECPLVDRADGERCRSCAGRILARALATGHDVAFEAARGTRDTERVIERFLVNAGRFKDFRVSRRIHDLVANQRFRVRRVRWRQVPA